MERWLGILTKMNPCKEAVEWAGQFKSLQEAWDKCERGDWMLWYAGMLSANRESDSRKRLALATCECVRLALPNVKKGERRPLKAIETAEAWARGKRGITLDMVRSASYAASAAAASASYAASSASAASASYAASSASYAASSAYAPYAATSASAASASASASYAASSKNETLKQCADIVRRYYPTPPKGES